MTESDRPVLRRLLIAAVATGVIASIAVGVSVLVTDETPPQFTSTVRFVDAPVSCVDVAVAYGYSRDAALPGPCSGSDSAVWFDLTVVNPEDRDGWLTECDVAGWTVGGDSVFRSPMQLFRISSGPAGHWVGARDTARLRWFVHVPDPARARPAPGGDVSMYSVRCPFVDWGGTPPP